MRLRQSNKLLMFKGIIKFLRSNDAIVSENVQFGKSLVKFEEAVTHLESKEQERQTVAEGKTEVKQSAREKLVETASEFAAGLFTYAQDNSLIELMKLTDLLEYEFDKLKTVDLSSRCSEIYKAAEGIISQLGEYDLDQAMLDEFKERIEAFELSVGEKESSTGKRSGAVKSVVQLFEEADLILKNKLDRFVEKVKAKKPEFYEQYQAVRNVKNIGIRHREKGDDTPPPANGWPPSR